MKNIITIIILSSIVNASSFKNTIYNDVNVSEVTSIYDGDTFRANLKGYPDIIGKRIPVRINGIDAPEIKGKCYKEKALAREAKMLAVEKLRNSKSIILKNVKRGKYFRIIADVYVDGESLADILLERNLAKEYNGSKKIDWCGEN